MSLVFTGPGGYTFTLYEGPQAGVVVSSPGAPLDHGTWIPLDELRAFTQALGHPTYIDVRGEDFPPGTRVHVLPGRAPMAEPWNHWCSEPCGADGCQGPESRAHLARTLYDTAPCFTCGRPRHVHSHPNQDHPFEDH